MQHNLFANCVKEGICSVTIISIPDWNGGRYPKAVFNMQPEDIKLQDFEYIEYSGSIYQSCKEADDRLFIETYQPPYEAMQEVIMTLGYLIERKLNRIKEDKSILESDALRFRIWD